VFAIAVFELVFQY